MFFWRRRPRIHYYAPAWNEELMLPFMIRHYSPWVERFVIYDNGSTDGSVEFLRRIPNVAIRKVPWTHPDSMVATLQDLQNNCWKESRGTADWVIVSDIDEFLCHPNLFRYLRRARQMGVTCIPALGYEMASERFPQPGLALTSAVRRGLPYYMLSKLRLFDPNAVAETNFDPGCHRAAPVGRIVYPKRDKLLLLHFKWLGFDYIRQRHAMLDATRRSRDVANRWASQYQLSTDDVAAILQRMLDQSVDVMGLGKAAWRSHEEIRWWRPNLRSAHRQSGSPRNVVLAPRSSGIKNSALPPQFSDKF